MSSEARFLINAIVVTIGDLLPLVTCLFAWFKGDRAERLGAALYGLAVLGTLGVEIITRQATPVTAELFFDTAVAVGFLVLAIRYNNLWLGAAMMVKGLQLAVHATRLTDGEDAMAGGVNLYAASLNLISLIICLILAGGTFATMRQRARQSRQPPPAEPVRNPGRLRPRSSGALHNS
ncbi:MAG TPA: hypothetical protein VIJ94_07855 [Caulobacteraceae bacterium]